MAGTPHLNFNAGMEHEHCHDKLSKHEFTSKNFNITTCPALEWAYVTGTKECPDSQMKRDRRIPQIAQLMELEEATKAGLILEEVTALVLYSGPMVYHGFIAYSSCLISYFRSILVVFLYLTFLVRTPWVLNLISLGMRST
jgi:hypothetical protein